MRLLRNTFRFIDDLIPVNNGGLFQKCYTKIDPAEFEVKKENKNNTETTFLDLDIEIINKKIQISLLDKRDSFPFLIKGILMLAIICHQGVSVH